MKEALIKNLHLFIPQFIGFDENLSILIFFGGGVSLKKWAQQIIHGRDTSRINRKRNKTKFDIQLNFLKFISTWRAYEFEKS